MSLEPQNPSEIIARQNDIFRKSWGRSTRVKGQIVQTIGVSDLGPVAGLVIANQIIAFDDFTEDNDPHGEHDFGAIEIQIDGAEKTVWWKIDLYDLTYRDGSEDRTNVAATRRVMTVLLPEEY